MYHYTMEEPGHVGGLLGAGNVVTHQYRYTPWGELEHEAEAVHQPLRYGAREWDAGVGLLQVRARWYDPQTGRFVSEDPIGLAGGINPYAYVGSSPVNGTDPSGLCYKGGWAWTINPGDGSAVSSGVCDALEHSISIEGLTDFLHGIATSAGAQGITAGSVRRQYESAVAGMDPNDSAARSALKAAMRAQTPPLIRGYIQLTRSDMGPRSGSVGHANVSNVGTNRAAALVKNGGRVLMVASVAAAVYEISTAEDPARETVVQAFGFVGGLGGGAAGGALGAFAGPFGMILGSGVGAGVGGMGGQVLGGWVYDRISR